MCKADTRKSDRVLVLFGAITAPVAGLFVLSGK
jgi:hypothetical protein